MDKIQSFAGIMVALYHREKDLLQYDESKEDETFEKEKKKHDDLSGMDNKYLEQNMN